MKRPKCWNCVAAKAWHVGVAWFRNGLCRWCNGDKRRLVGVMPTPEQLDAMEDFACEVATVRRSYGAVDL